MAGVCGHFQIFETSELEDYVSSSASRILKTDLRGKYVPKHLAPKYSCE
jgi:hypothetical protein